ncbi:MAG: SDR family NAD(P)-dependent oxidoreductase, partial [Candidatus Rokubacteria bacterium]|nr:SDR family NAD(P)-dependent oxidoreductase [Candidatus Rokubacteria bacterium]MBI4255497.1 SDR family NAD(P)-dependent oxidoreductase [Candidatus Rokubacteria bacterium]
MKLKGQTALVTGGGRGIGRAIVLALAREGAQVAVLDIDRDAAEVVRREAEQLGVKALALGVDLTRRAEVERGIAELLAQWGQLD